MSFNQNLCLFFVLFCLDKCSCLMIITLNLKKLLIEKYKDYIRTQNSFSIDSNYSKFKTGPLAAI